MKRTFNPLGELIIEDVQVWMDGGTVTLITRDSESNNFEIEFVQKVFLKRTPLTNCPGSLLLDKQEVEIRSEQEVQIIAAVKTALFGEKVIEKEKRLLKQIIVECVDFIGSDAYIDISQKLGRSV